MEINIAICDDEKAEIDYLTLLINKWANQKKLLIKISSFLNAESFLFQYSDNKDFDIILLDVQMGKINGIELAKEIRKDNDSLQIIFVTGFFEFISEGYEVDALHYMAKPVKEEKMLNVLSKAYNNLAQVEKPLILKIDGELHRVSLMEICYIEAESHYIKIKTNSEVYKIKMNLSDIEKNLDKRFFRCQRSFIINICYIKKIKRTAVILDSMDEIPISRNLFETLNHAVINYFP